jgi:hypothetical protein
MGQFDRLDEHGQALKVLVTRLGQDHVLGAFIATFKSGVHQLGLHQ